MTYRPDIDGMRAIAVLLVVAFHYGVEPLSGGFAGVDIFFVISGYLITEMIAREIAEERFSLVGFYLRRAARLFPALAVLILAVLVTGAFVLAPSPFVELGKSAFAASLFLANVFFSRRVDYWNETETQPALLHTWSLGVEEQYYLVIPFLMLMAARFGARGYVVLMLGTAALSLSAAEALIGSRPVDVFYLTPFRLWELALGGLGAIVSLRLPSGAVRGLLGALAIVVLGLTGTLMSRETPFPGVAALAPCVATLVLLKLGEVRGDWSRRVLAFEPLRRLGLVSYPLYLWHWPVFVFATRMNAGEPPSPPALIFCFVTSLAAAVLSNRFIEMPLRRRARRIARARSGWLAALCAPLALTAVAGILIVLFQGFAWRIPSDLHAYVPAPFQNEAYTKCIAQRDADTPPLTCRFDSEHASRMVVMWGDSHVAAHYANFAGSTERHGYRALVTGKGSCAPLLDVRTFRRGLERRSCEVFNRRMVGVLRDMKPDVVLLVARWPVYFDPALLGQLDRIDVLPGSGGTSHEYAAVDGLRKTLAAIEEIGAVPIILGPTPDFSMNPNHCFITRSMIGADTGACDLPVTEVKARLATTDRILDGLSARRVDPPLIELLCDRTNCPAVAADGRRYHDEHHLSTLGARMVFPAIEGEILRAFSTLPDPPGQQD